MKNISDNPFWDYSVQVWPTAGETLLMLQETYQLDINMLLFCCWLAKEHRVFRSSEQLAHYWPEISRWQNEIILPLRIIRQKVKAISLPDASIQAIYSQCKQVELDAERIQQKRLFNLKDLLSESNGLHSHNILEENLRLYLHISDTAENNQQIIQTLLAHCQEIIKGP